MSDFRYENESDTEPASLAAHLAAELEKAAADPVHKGEDFAIYRDGDIVSWRDQGEDPWRRAGTVDVYTPGALATLLDRHATAHTVLYADPREGRIVAVVNDHPKTDPDFYPSAGGWGDFRITMVLRGHEDWAAWKLLNQRPMTQVDFGTHLEDLRHTVVRPSSAEMLEVATTLTAKRKVDFESRNRLDNGDVEFRFVEETNARAGRSTSVEIPTSFVITVPFWEGTDPVALEAILRFKASQDGVLFTYRFLRQQERQREAFQEVVAAVLTGSPDTVTVVEGAPPRMFNPTT